MLLLDTHYTHYTMTTDLVNFRVLYFIFPTQAVVNETLWKPHGTASRIKTRPAWSQGLSKVN